MGIDRITRHVAAWIACIAMLFAAMAPSLSQAMVAAPGNTWAEICSVGGTKFVEVTADAGEVSHHSQSDSLYVEHCPLCATHAGAFALPATAGYSIPLIQPQASHPFLFFQSPHPLAIWNVARSRAPPSHG